MPIPVPVASTPLHASDAETARAEQFLSELFRVIRCGTTGGTTDAPAGLIPGANPSLLDPVIIDTAEKQLFFRHHALALVKTLTALASATTIGVSRLSSDPTDPALPTALNADDVSVTPGPNLVPRARPDGTLDPVWISGSGSSSAIGGVFTGTCLSSIAAGDLVYVSGGSRAVSRIDITNPVKVPCIGAVVSKPTATTCLVQTGGVIESVYAGLIPNAPYFCSTLGRPTTSKPSGTDVAPVYVIPIGYAIDASTLLLRPTTIVKARS